MKKDILLFLTIILISIGAYFLTYNILSNSEKEEIVNVELTYEELKHYITYVPIDQYNNFNPYNEDTNINNIGPNVLISFALQKASQIECSDTTKCGDNLDKKVKNLDVIYSKYYSLDYINSILKEMYDYELKDLNETTTSENTYNSSAGRFAFEDNFFYKVGDTTLSNSNIHRNLITGYSANNKYLIIEEYAGYGDESDFALKDYRNDKIVEINYDFYDQFENYIHNFFINKRQEFTKYRHTYKKGEQGYYWYSSKAI